MDDIGKALVMAVQVLMFVLAATVSIYLYSTLTDSIDSIMLANNYSNRGDAIVADQDTDTKRTATKAEVIMAILNLKDKYEKTYDNAYTVQVGGRTYKYNNIEDAISINGATYTFNTWNLWDKLDDIADSNYKLDYDENGKALIYTIK